jgi:hypothetical protein
VIPPPPNLPPPRANSTPWRRAANVAGVAIAFALAFVLRIPICPFAIITRHPCPGCGLTRAGVALLQGHIHDAVHLHPLVIPVVPIVGLAVLHGTYNYIRYGRWYSFAFVQSRTMTIGTIILGVAVIGVWIARFFGAFGGPVSV